MSYHVSLELTEHTSLEDIANSINDNDREVYEGVSFYEPESSSFGSRQVIKLSLMRTADGYHYIDCTGSTEPDLLADHIENELCREYQWNAECTNERRMLEHTSLFEIEHDSVDDFKMCIACIKFNLAKTFRRPH